MTLIESIADMESRTPIQNFYAGQNVLITGGTGFLGKLLIEKLLRCCPDLSSVYVVIRPKKGQDAHSRLDVLFDDVVFDRLKKEVPKFRLKVTAIPGDCSLPGLDISTTDKEFLVRETSIVFNVAATVRFDEKIKQAVAINVNSIREILELSRSMKNLKSFIHVSTAYSNCIRLDIEEKYYEPPISGDNAIKLMQCLDDKKLDAITPTLLGSFPNTYAFTKNIAEQVVQQYGKDLPAGVFRPAMVISTYQEPVSGWIDNVYGPTGALVGGGAGFIRTLNLNQDNPAELIPADLTVNALIATAWDVAHSKNEDAEPPIFNYVASWEDSQLKWGHYVDLAFKYGKQKPTMRSIWCYTLTSTKSLFMYSILSFFLHILPAFIVDVGFFVLGKEPKMLKIYKKIHKFAEVTSYFSIRKWDFGNVNTRALWDKLCPEDKELFLFSMKDFDWDDYMSKCVDGLRLYVFKDDPTNVYDAKKRMKRIVLLHRFLKYALYGLALYALYHVFSYALASLGTSKGLSVVSETVTIR